LRAALLALSSLLCLPAYAVDVAYQNHGLSWSRPSKASVPHADAAAQCARLGAGWRLPTEKEFRANWYKGTSLTDRDDALKKALDPDRIDYLHFWTTTVYRDGNFVLESPDYANRRDRTHTEPSEYSRPFACVKGALPTATAAAKPASAAKSTAVVPKLTLKSNDFEQKEREHQQKVARDMEASKVRGKADQAEAEARTARDRQAVKARDAANYKPCPAGQSCNTSK
jgi:hypothetical protein